jgi:hypothetical protein
MFIQKEEPLLRKLSLFLLSCLVFFTPPFAAAQDHLHKFFVEENSMALLELGMLSV